MRLEHTIQTLLRPNIHLNNAGGFKLPALALKRGRKNDNEQKQHESNNARFFVSQRRCFYNPSNKMITCKKNKCLRPQTAAESSFFSYPKFTRHLCGIKIKGERRRETARKR